MYINNRPLSAGYKFFIAVISWLSLWLLFSTYQTTAFIFLATFLAIFAGVYFTCAAFKVLFWHQKHPWRAFSPVWQGSLLIGSLLASLTQVLATTFPDTQILLPVGIGGLLANYILPLLIIFDWVLFSAKGHWRWIDPWYWLYLPLIYLAINYLLIGVVIGTDTVVYPYGFMNYQTIGVIPTIIWLVGILAGCLILGFLLVGSDLALCPKASTKSVVSSAKSAPTPKSSPSQPEPTQPPLESTPSEPEPVQPNSVTALTNQPAPTKAASAPDSATSTKSTSRPKSSQSSRTKSTPKLVDVRPNTKSRRKSTNKKPRQSTKTKTSATTDDTKAARSVHGKTQVKD